MEGMLYLLSSLSLNRDTMVLILFSPMNTYFKWGDIFAAWNAMSNPEYQDFLEHSIYSRRMHSTINYAFGNTSLVKELSPQPWLPFLFKSSLPRKHLKKKYICVETKHKLLPIV